MNKLLWLIRPINSHSEDEDHRQASWLELFVDIGFVMAIGAITIAFDNGLSLRSLLTYTGSFTIIFWIWNRFTWYATFYDNGDVPFRLCFIATIFCVLGIASSVEGALTGSLVQFSFYYLLIELILLYLWGRVWRKDKNKKDRTQAKYFFVSYCIGTLLIAVSLLINGEAKVVLWICAVITEAIGPVIAWQKLDSNISVNTHHVVERHGLFTIILLGEGIIAVSHNLTFPASLTNTIPPLVAYCIVALLWWIYFDYGFGFSTNLSNNSIRVFIFGYGQFFVFLSLSMVAVSLELGLHSLLETDVARESNYGVGNLLLWSTSTFILTMSAIQMVISTINPQRVYLPRFFGGAFLSVLAAFSSLSFINSMMIVFFVLLAVVLNEIHQWSVLGHKYES